MKEKLIRCGAVCCFTYRPQRAAGLHPSDQSALANEWDATNHEMDDADRRAGGFAVGRGVGDHLRVEHHQVGVGADLQAPFAPRGAGRIEHLCRKA